MRIVTLLPVTFFLLEDINNDWVLILLTKVFCKVVNLYFCSKNKCYINDSSEQLTSDIITTSYIYKRSCITCVNPLMVEAFMLGLGLDYSFILAQ